MFEEKLGESGHFARIDQVGLGHLEKKPRDQPAEEREARSGEDQIDAVQRRQAAAYGLMSDA